MKNKLFFILILAGLGNTVFAQNTPLSLTEAIEKSLNNNYQILIANANTLIAENNNSWGNAGLFPSVNLNFADNNRLQKINNPTSFINGDLRTIGLSGQVDVQWTIFNGMRVTANKSRLEKIQQQTQGRATIVVQNTLQAVILAYFDALVEQKKLKTLETTQKLSKDRWDYVKTKKGLGTATTFDELQAETAYNNDLQNYLLQEVNYKNTIRQLKQVMAENTNEVTYVLSDSLFVKQMDYKIEDLSAMLLEKNEQIKNEYINQEILKKQYEVEQANMFPRLNLNLGSNQALSNIKLNSLPSREARNADYYVNFTLNYNLFNGFNTQRNIENARIQRVIGELTLSEMKQSLSYKLENELETYNARKKLIEVATNNAERSKLNLQIAEEKFKNGTISSFEFRDVQNNALRAEMSRLDAIYNLITSETEIARLTGSILRE